MTQEKAWGICTWEHCRYLWPYNCRRVPEVGEVLDGAQCKRCGKPVKRWQRARASTAWRP